MGAIKIFDPFGIFCVGGGFLSPANALETTATTISTRMLVTLLFFDMRHSLPEPVIAPLLDNNLLDVLRAGFARALLAAYRVGLMDRVAENDRSALQIGNLDAGLFV